MKLASIFAFTFNDFLKGEFMSNTWEMQRTFALVGTGGSGKTSVAEMLLYQTKNIDRLGAIEAGTTSLDYEPEEIKRRASTQVGFATWLFNKNRHFLVDIPGDDNFSGDINYLLQAVDSVVLTIDAVDGVRPLTKKIWQSVRDQELPAIAFINKMDRERADFDNAINGLSTSLQASPVVLFSPIVQDEKLLGYIDIFGEKAFFYDGDVDVKEGAIPDDLVEEMALMRDTSIENIAESDEELLEKYLEEGTLSAQEIEQGLRIGVLSGDLLPVVMGSALENRGGTRLLEAIEKYLPSPKDRAPYLSEEADERIASDDQPAAAFVFKTIADPFAGQLSMIRVLSGTVSSDSTLKNCNTEENERLSSLSYLVGKNQTPCKETLYPGAIVAVSKLKNTRTGDTLADEKELFALAKPDLPASMITYSLAAQNKGEEDKVFAAVQKVLEEDITLKLDRDEETGDVLLSGMGQLHIELSVEKAKRRYKTEIVLKTPKIPYRETIRGNAKVQGRHKKQSGGRGQFGDCHIEISALPRGTGYEFEDNIVGGAIPRTYIPAIDKGIQESALRGYIAGYPVVDFKIRLYDGSYHDVDSSEMAFKLAGSQAFKKAMEEVKVILLEPVALATISVPDEYMGDVIGDISSRRGKILGSDSVTGITEIQAHVPMSEILRYAPDLRSMTGGQGLFTMVFDHYQEAPQPIADKVIADYEQNKGEDKE